MDLEEEFWLFEGLHGIRERLDNALEGQGVTTSEVEGATHDMIHLGEVRQNEDGKIQLRSKKELQVVADDVKWWLDFLNGMIRSL